MGKSKSTTTTKKWIRKIHLYLGLATGLVVLIVSLTGCLWVFQEEINELTSGVPQVEPQNAEKIDPLEAKNMAQTVFPGKHVHGTLYEGGANPIQVIFYEEEPEEFYSSVFLNPWDGEVLHIENHLTGFFHFILDGHMHLWLPPVIGSEIVAWSTVIFFLMIISGIILWWPKNKKVRGQRTWFRWNPGTKWKRKNYDLHQIVGFYASFIAVFFILTGLIMTFDAFSAGFYKAIGGEKGIEFSVPLNNSGALTTKEGEEPIRELMPMLQERFPDAKDYEIHYPYDENYSIYVEVSNSDGIYYDSDYRFYDQNNLAEVPSESIYGVYEEAGFSETVLRMNYDIHVGAIGGIPGKVLAFFISLFCASLPVTGFLLWYGRTFKTKKSQVKVEKKERVMAYQQ
ncbi:PepSY-associated TM helix domain-containing protein [Salegentibacter sp. F188]|uniref:PepSY-associated TM helix domain-containing protein n=1 Tax=Autumnicola patrickiae TaxID=3075591 RepID=A0ABU3DYJ9_9FLAO|nr:PepSY-associated TM helix domain-containing protein [Salegentibacter sp. F188]MDT0688793.1 PepSY-associated TM helix domain-containing protein [Salegentibacter sp. F188]